LISHLFLPIEQIRPGQNKDLEIKPILGDIPSFSGQSINFCFNAEARQRTIRDGFLVQPRFRRRRRYAGYGIARCVFPISNACWALGSMSTILRATPKDCGKRSSMQEARKARHGRRRLA
jgi:hypothetical protein